MCGRFVAASPPSLLVEHFRIDEVRVPDDELPPPSWNVAPTERVTAVAEHGRRRLLGAFQWGLVPSWSEDASGGARMINARAETLAEKPAYREAFARRRCLIPVDGFYEWRLTTGGAKQPLFIAPEPGAGPLALAGLWEAWRAPGSAQGAPPLRTCTIVTTAANAALSSVHTRMPVVLPASTWSTWLDPDERDVDLLASLLVPAPDDLLHVREASRLVNDVRQKGPEVLDPSAAPSSTAARSPDPPSPPTASLPGLA